MEILRFVSDLLLSNMYILKEGESAIVIDPCRNIAPAEGLHLDWILLTHEHYDHISGVNDWKKLTGAPVLCSKKCAEGISDPKKNLSKIFPVFCELQTWIKLDSLPDADQSYSVKADETFSDKRLLSWKGHEIRLFELPGHSPGGTGIIVDENTFFSGDSLMKDTVVELRLPGGNKKDWETVSLPKLSKLPENISVYPGHFEPFVYNMI